MRRPSDEDPSGYFRLRAEAAGYVEELRAGGHAAEAERIASALDFLGLPTEWMGELALALNAAVSSPEVPAALKADMKTTVKQIRRGFRRSGIKPKF